MPDLTVIDGRGGKDSEEWDRAFLQQHFEEFVVTLLRDLASGSASHHLTERFFRFVEHAQKTKLPIAPTFDGAVRQLYSRALGTDTDSTDYAYEQKQIIEAALRVFAESMATDSFARARRSKREDQLTHALERKIRSSEKRSRENGWSYVTKVTEGLPKPASRKHQDDGPSPSLRLRTAPRKA